MIILFPLSFFLFKKAVTISRKTGNLNQY
jgi:hypothetical protein